MCVHVCVCVCVCVYVRLCLCVHVCAGVYVQAKDCIYVLCASRILIHPLNFFCNNFFLPCPQALTYVLRAAPPEAVALELPRVLPLLVQALSCDVTEVGARWYLGTLRLTMCTVA